MPPDITFVKIPFFLFYWQQIHIRLTFVSIFFNEKTVHNFYTRNTQHGQMVKKNHCRLPLHKRTNFPKFAWLSWPHRTAPHHLTIVEAAAAAAPPEAARGLVSARTVFTRIGRECGGIPVGSGEVSSDLFLDWRFWRRSVSGRILLRLSKRPIAILE